MARQIKHLENTFHLLSQIYHVYNLLVRLSFIIKSIDYLIQILPLYIEITLPNGLQHWISGQPGQVRRPHPGGGLHQGQAETDAAVTPWSNWTV